MTIVLKTLPDFAELNSPLSVFVYRFLPGQRSIEPHGFPLRQSEFDGLIAITHSGRGAVHAANIGRDQMSGAPRLRDFKAAARAQAADFALGPGIRQRREEVDFSRPALQ